ncbi:MAG: glycosyltransferase family 39 protein [Anaerolineae bacterium]|nr:glycosyltransferase family 39 protein [Anaerolineae bacterium]
MSLNSLNGLIALAATGVGLSFMVLWARALLGRAERDPLLIALTTLALSVGALSLILLWQGILTPPLDWRSALIAALAVGAAGGFAFWRAKGGERTAERPDDSPRDWLAWLAVAVVVLICALILFNAVYWPFSIDDAVTIYARYGKEIWQTGQLPRGTLYETYPMLVPLWYAFTHGAAGGLDQGLARLIPALLSVGAIGASFLLGRELYGGRTGLAAALLAALTPMVTHWASTGYVDLPTGFFIGMSALFLARHARRGGWTDTLLAGLMGGLAAWTKNSGLLIAPSLVLWLIYRVLAGQSKPGAALRHGAILALGMAITAGPWYARNVLTAGLIVPPTGWTWLAQRTLANLFPFVQDDRYLPVGALFVAGLLWFMGRAMWSRGRDWRAALLVILYGPFFAAWWTLVSYDERFLLALTPLVAVMAARTVLDAAGWLAVRIRLRPALAHALAALIILVTALPAAAAALDFKGELLRRPLMGLDERARIALGPRHAIAREIAALPPGSRVWLSDPILTYHAGGGPVQVTLGGPPTRESLAGYDYVVLDPGADSAPAGLADAAPRFEAGGYRLYRVTGE